MTPAKNQSWGLFGPIQKTNCLAVMPEGTAPQPAGSVVDCLRCSTFRKKWCCKRLGGGESARGRFALVPLPERD